MNHDQTAFHRLALYFGQSDIAFGLWICVIAIVLIAGVGYGCICVTAGTPDPEGSRSKESA